MPADFLTAQQKNEYGQFSCNPNEMQLARYFLLDQSDRAFISKCRGKGNRLGMAIQLTSVRFLGAFLSDVFKAPRIVKTFLAKQLSIDSIGILKGYAHRKATKRGHTALIKSNYGYNDFGSIWSFRLTRQLYARAWISNERPSIMFDFATKWLIEHKILLPGASTLMRLISEVRKRAADRLWLKLESLSSQEQKNQLESLLQLKEDQRITQFDNYRKGPTTVSVLSFEQAIKRYKGLHVFGTSKMDFSKIPPVRLKILARHASVSSSYKISRMSEKKRTAILLAFTRS